MEQTKEQETIPLMSSVGWRFTLDGKRIGVLQNFTISAGVDKKDDYWVHFDGERLEMFPKDKDGNSFKLDEMGELIKYNMSERAASEHNGYIVVKNITVDENGNPTINLITLLKEKE
jgi:hypothetical protein